ncbi:MAG: 3D domain-containing protein, partial [Actinobacteria bacterium]|nr:3D domain-containing protein [Actinomycetota bacterium]
KYNIIINILFWAVTSAVISVFAIALLWPDLKINNYLFGTHKEIIVKTEPVVVTEYKNIEKNNEWFYFIATGYSKNDPQQGTNDITATGKTVREGIIAVDPDIIPFGTVIEIKELGYFVAEDCGSKIKGNRIDIYFDSKEEAKDFGRQGLWIRIIDDKYYQVAQIKASIIQDQLN